MLAHVHLHEHAESHAGGPRRLRQRFHILGLVDADAHLGPPCQFSQPAHLDRANDLVGNEDVGKPGIGEDFGLVELGAEKAASARRRNIARQPGALQRLEMDAHGNRPVAKGAEHPPQVGVDNVEIDHQLRRVERRERLADYR